MLAEAWGADTAVPTKSVHYPVPGVSAEEARAGVIRRFGHGEPQFNLGVSTLALGPDGRVWGNGLHWIGGDGYGRILNTLFSVSPDGSDFRPALTINRAGEAAPLTITVTREGTVFAHVIGTRGPWLRFQPQTGQGADLATNMPAITTVASAALRQLSDGHLYATTANGFLRLSESGREFRSFDLRGTGLKAFAAAITEDAVGWLYLVAQRGGPEDGGGVVRCRTDGTAAAALAEFGSDGTDDGNSLNHKSALGLTRDGQLYGTLGTYQRGHSLYRLSSEGGHRMLGYLTATNAAGVRLAGGLSEDQSGFLWGRIQNGGWLRISPAGEPETGGSPEPLLDGGWVMVNGPGNQHWPLTNTGSTDWLPLPDGRLLTASGFGLVSLLPIERELRPIRHWGPTGGDGETPAGPPISDGRGNLLGIATGGGLTDAGVVYSAAEDGSTGAILHVFSGATGNVLNPSGFLARGDDGWIYGTSQQGAAGDLAPKLFRLRPDSGEFEILASLPGRFDHPDQPRCGLVRAGNGQLFGTTPRGGGPDLGTLFRYDPARRHLEIIHEFGHRIGDRWRARPELLISRDGHLYGLGISDGPGQTGSDGLFRFRPDGTGYEVMDYLPKRDTGLRIAGGLTEGGDGHLYTVRARETTAPTNVTVVGQIIRLVRPSKTGGMFRTEVAFESHADTEPAFAPSGSLVEDPEGWLVGQGYRWWNKTRTLAVCRWHPVTGTFERIAVGGGRLPVSASQFQDLIPPQLRPSGELIVALADLTQGGADSTLRRISLKRPAPPVALEEPQLVGTYGHLLQRSFFPAAFSNAVETAAIQLETVAFSPRPALSVAGISVTPVRPGTHRLSVVASDGLYPPALTTNWINLTVNRAPLQAQGNRRVRAVGASNREPFGRLVGVVNQDRITAEWTTAATSDSPAGEYPVTPTFLDPDGRLENYSVSIIPGAIKVVAPAIRAEVAAAGAILIFPGIPGLRIAIDASPSLSPPNWARVNSFTVTSEEPPPLYLPVSPDRPSHFFRAVIE